MVAGYRVHMADSFGILRANCGKRVAIGTTHGIGRGGNIHTETQKNREY